MIPTCVSPKGRNIVIRDFCWILYDVAKGTFAVMMVILSVRRQGEVVLILKSQIPKPFSGLLSQKPQGDHGLGVISYLIMG